MSEELKTIIFDAVPADELDLGFLVLNKRYPLQNCYNPCSPPAATDNAAPATVALRPPEANGVQAKDFRSWSESVRSTNLVGGLSKLVSATLGAGNKLDADRKSQSIEIHTMKNQLDWFNTAQKDPGVRQWLEDELKFATNFYMVVGHSAVDCMSISTDRRETLSTSGKAGIIVPGLDPTGELSKVEAGAAHNSAAEQYPSATFAQKIICAVQYQKVEFRLFPINRKDLGEATPETKSDKWVILEGGTREKSDIVAGVESEFCEDDKDAIGFGGTDDDESDDDE